MAIYTYTHKHTSMTCLREDKCKLFGNKEEDGNKMVCSLTQIYIPIHGIYNFIINTWNS